jgi:multidrug efflux pump
LIVVAKDLAARDRLQLKLEEELAEQFPEIVSRGSPLELGPPVGWPLQYRVSGPDQDEMRQLALKVANLLGTDPRARQVNFDRMEPARQIQIRVNQDEARRLGVSSGALASIMHAILTGTTITQVCDDIYLIDVVARAGEKTALSLATLSTLQIPTPAGAMVPLSQFATFGESQELPLLWRRDRVPTLTVRADVVHGVLPDNVVEELAPKMEEFNAKLPPRYKLETGGLYEESKESQASVFAVVPLMLVFMLMSMMVLLVSFRRLAMVVCTMPLGLIGVVLTLLAFNRPLGFVAILGILALIGMIAKNAVIVIVQIETFRAEGRPTIDAIVDSGTLRIRPMMLTSISTVLGLIPIAPTVFWGSMAFAIMGGLLVATVLTLVFLPALYMAVFAPCAPGVTPSWRARRGCWFGCRSWLLSRAWPDVSP